MLYSALLPVFVATALALPQGSTLAPPPVSVVPDWATIDSVTFAGTGCPANSASAQLSGDKQTINLSFSSFFAQYYKNNPQSERTSNCNINIKVKVPAGITVTVATADIRGFATIDATCSAAISGKVWWSGSLQEATCSATLPGPSQGDFTESLSVPTIAWSKCGADGPLLNINTRLLAQCSNSANTAYINTEAIDTNLDTKFHWDLGLVYARC